jgi:hypothetical protein
VAEEAAALVRRQVLGHEAAPRRRAERSARRHGGVEDDQARDRLRPEERADERQRQPQDGLRRGRPEDEPFARVEPADRVRRPQLDERHDEVADRAQESDLEARGAERERERRHERLGETGHDRRERRLAARDGQAARDVRHAGLGRLRRILGHERPTVGSRQASR